MGPMDQSNKLNQIFDEIRKNCADQALLRNENVTENYINDSSASNSAEEIVGNIMESSLPVTEMTAFNSVLEDIFISENVKISTCLCHDDVLKLIAKEYDVLFSFEDVLFGVHPQNRDNCTLGRNQIQFTEAQLFNSNHKDYNHLLVWESAMNTSAPFSERCTYELFDRKS